MRHLNIDELNEVHGGGLSANWARRAGELIADFYRMYPSSEMIEVESASYGNPDAGGYNAMGDYANNTCPS
jgi:hypothetical protein